jgi:hypothetical protein
VKVHIYFEKACVIGLCEILGIDSEIEKEFVYKDQPKWTWL